MTGTFLERFAGPIRVNSSRTRFFFTETETRKATIAKNYEPIQVEGGGGTFLHFNRAGEDFEIRVDTFLCIGRSMCGYWNVRLSPADPTTFLTLRAVYNAVRNAERFEMR